MPCYQSERLGALSYGEDAVLEFPRGLPGFEERRLFVAIQLPASSPLVFLQSLEDAGLCFIAAPVAAIRPGYGLEVSEEDLETVGLPPGRQPEMGVDVLCLVVLSMHETGATANLLAPVVVNLANRKAVQAVAPEGMYSHRHAFMEEAEAVCS